MNRNSQKIIAWTLIGLAILIVVLVRIIFFPVVSAGLSNTRIGFEILGFLLYLEPLRRRLAGKAHFLYEKESVNDYKDIIAVVGIGLLYLD